VSDTQPIFESDDNGHLCRDHCPRELDHERYFARGLPAPCGCTPAE
jgi:hypothetical protein